jgi:hypothetical protein
MLNASSDWAPGHNRGLSGASIPFEDSRIKKPAGPPDATDKMFAKIASAMPSGLRSLPKKIKQSNFCGLRTAKKGVSISPPTLSPAPTGSFPLDGRKIQTTV